MDYLLNVHGLYLSRKVQTYKKSISGGVVVAVVVNSLYRQSGLEMQGITF